MRFSVVFVRFAMPLMENDSLAQLIRATRARDCGLRVIDNWGNPETLTALWDRVLREESSAGADVGVLLNSDCWVARGWDDAVMAAFADPTVGAAGPSCNTGPTTVPYHVRTRPETEPDHPYRGWPVVEDVDRAGDRCREVGAGKIRDSEVFGHCYAVRLKDFERLAGLRPEVDDGYTLYGSEQSFSRRLRADARRVVWVEGAYCYHVGEMSGRAAAGRGEVDLAAERERGRKLFFGSNG